METISFFRQLLFINRKNGSIHTTTGEAGRKKQAGGFDPMSWGFFLGLSAAVFILALVISVSLLIRKYESKRIVSPFNTLFVGVLVSVFIALIPVQCEILREYSSGILRVILSSFHETMQVFTINIDRDLLLENVRCANATVQSAYSSYLSVMFVVAPLLTFGFLISIFNNIKAYRKYLTHYWSDVYVFSEINEKSFSLAQSLKTGHPEAIVAFSGSKEDTDEWHVRAREIGAIRFYDDLLSINFARHSRKAEITFFAISEDEAENVQLALRLIETYREREHTSVYVVSSGIEGELLLSNVEKGSVRVRRVNEVRSLIYHDLYNQGTSLFERALFTDGKKKKISAVIIGLGQYGVEMLKALTWYCQMDGYCIVIDAFDQDPAAEERLRVQCPELLSEEFNGKEHPGDAYYTIRIHSGADITTKSFFDELSKLKETTYTLIALGSDELNLRTAVAVRQQFIRMKLQHTPTIQAIIYSTEKKDALKDMKNFRGEKYGIEFIGDLKNSYSEDVMINSRLEQEALKGHLAWGKEEEFWNYEYNYRSSMASAIHRKAREKCRIAGADKTEKELTEAERTIIESLEHRRWNAYMRSEGYIYSGSKDKSSRNDLGKMHHDLVGYESLDEEEKRKDSKVGSKKK